MLDLDEQRRRSWCRDQGIRFAHQHIRPAVAATSGIGTPRLGESKHDGEMAISRGVGPPREAPLSVGQIIGLLADLPAGAYLACSRIMVGAFTFQYISMALRQSASCFVGSGVGANAAPKKASTLMPTGDTSSVHVGTLQQRPCLRALNLASLVQIILRAPGPVILRLRRFPTLAPDASL